MNKGIKEKWVTALRSGDFAQGKGYLHQVSSNSYCCLGVLCKIAVEEGVVESSVRNDEDEVVTGFGINDEYSILPHEVVTWGELPSSDPSMVYRPEGGDPMYSSLAELNDDFELTFEEIANLIEGQL